MAMEEDEAAFLRYVGEGETIPTPPAGEAHLEDDEWSYNMNGFPDMLSEADSESSFAQTFPTPYSRKFQLLPCQVDWEPETLEPHINSYINNFHPTKHKRLYKILTDTFFTVSPLWEKSLGSRQLRHKDRIPYNIVKYPVFKASELANEDENFDPEELICDPDGPCEQPEPGDFKPREGNPKLELNFQQLFPSLQVIFKMTNVELTPEKPKYEGVDWHIEGQLNDRICSTVMCFYDSDNVTDTHIEFRQRADIQTIRALSETPHNFNFIQEIYGFPPETDYVNDTNVTQYLGSLFCRDKRAISYPNYLQNRMHPFELVDKSKPGYRKILTLHLVDPHFHIISTAHVPPQQEDWDAERKALIDHILATRLPPELQRMVEDEMGLGKPMTMDEARKYRLEMIEEREKQADQIQKPSFERVEFCTGGFVE